MEKVKEPIVLFKELIEQCVECCGSIRQEDIDMAYTLAIGSAQSEALSVGNNEQAKECCPRCGSTATQPMGKAMMCNNCENIWAT